MTTDPPPTWNRGYRLLMVAPFIGLFLIITDPPRWLQIIGLLAILACVGAGAGMMRRRTGGLRPSETLGRRDDHRDDGGDDVR